MRENNPRQNCNCNCKNNYVETDKYGEPVKRPHVDTEVGREKDSVDELEEIVTAALDNVSEVVTDMIDAFVDGWVAGRKNRQK